MKVLSNYRVCEAIKNQQVSSCCNQHVVFKKIDPFVSDNKSYENKFYWSLLCILLSSNETCTKCLNFELNRVFQIKKPSKTAKQSAANLILTNSKAPFSKLSNERVKATLQHYRIENIELQLELERSFINES